MNNKEIGTGNKEISKLGTLDFPLYVNTYALLELLYGGVCGLDGYSPPVTKEDFITTVSIMEGKDAIYPFQPAEWVKKGIFGEDTYFVCSHCKIHYKKNVFAAINRECKDQRIHFCPNCGAEMKPDYKDERVAIQFIEEKGD